jgi:hypothetical protein
VRQQAVITHADAEHSGDAVQEDGGGDHPCIDEEHGAIAPT